MKIISLLGIVIPIVYAAVRFIPLFTSDDINFYKGEVWVCLGLVVWFFISITWISRRKCPNCRADKYDTISSEETDRWVGTKKVRGKDGKNRSTIQHTSTTFVEITTTYLCRMCKCQWLETKKKEKI